MARNNNILLLLVILLISGVCSWSIQPFFQRFLYFRNLNHFNADDNTKIETDVQVYSENYKSSSNSPLLVYLTTNPNETYPSLMSLSRLLSGALIILPTRFFEDNNLPSDFFDVSNLKYLSLNQIIEDVREFILQFIEDNAYFSVTPSNPIILIGKDFLGSVSYFTKLKYPDLFKGAIAQDPILYAKVEFPAYDRYIYNKFSQIDLECPTLIQNMNEEIELVISDNSELKSKSLLDVREQLMAIGSNAEILEFISNILYELAEDQVESEIFCYFLTSSLNLNQKIKALLDSKSKMKTQLPISKDSDVHKRLKMWLDCMYFGLFPIADSPKNIKSKQFDSQFFKKQCEDKFKSDDNITFDYTDVNIQSQKVEFLTNILLISTNSISRKALQEHDPKEIATILCEDCDHTASFVEPRNSVMEVISKIQLQIEEWIKST